MGKLEIIGAVVGFLIIAVVLWKVVRTSITRSNGKVETWDITGRNNEWMGE